MKRLMRLMTLLVAITAITSLAAPDTAAQSAKTAASQPSLLQSESSALVNDVLPGHDLAIDFTYEGLMFCDVKVADSDRVWKFLIDSGAGSSVLNQRTADELGIEGMEIPGGVKGVGEQEATVAQGVKLTVGDHEWNAAMVAILDLSSIADQTGEWMDGIIGADWLMQFDLCKFDFKENRAYFKIGEGGRKNIAELMQEIQKAMGGGGIPGLPQPGNPGEDDKEDAERKDPQPRRGGADDMLERMRKAMEGASPFGGRGTPQKPRERKKAEDREGEYGPAEAFPLIRPTFVGLQSNGRMGSFTTQDAEPEERLNEAEGNAIPRAALKAPTESVTIDFRMLEMGGGMLGDMLKGMLGMAPVLDAHWFVDIEIDGQSTEIIFDTGAMGLFALDLRFSDKAGLGRSFDIPVTGVGKSTAYMGIVQEFSVGAHSESGEYSVASLDLSQLDFDKIADEQPILKMLMPEKTPKPIGLLGIEFARRYRYMTVDHANMHITFDPYSEDELATIDTDGMDEEMLVIEAIKNTWAGKGGSLGFEAESLPIEEWEKYGVQGGLRITSVAPRSGAEAAGLERGDVIISLIGEDPTTGETGEQPLRSIASAAFLAAMSGAGEVIAVIVLKGNGEQVELSFEIEPFEGDMIIPERYKAEVEARRAGDSAPDEGDE